MPRTPETKVRLLLVEDEGVTAMDTAERLESLGYEVTAAVFSGRDAIRSVLELRPDLVLMDIRLKGDLDGIAAAKELRARFDVPIVFATAYADEATVERAKTAEPFGYVLKPFDERELRTTIEVALYKHRMERQRSDVLAMLSHDIRNPLGVVLGYTEMLGERLRDGADAESSELLQQLTSTAVSIHSLVTNYLELSRLESGQLAMRPEAVAVPAVVERVRAQYAAEARRRRVRIDVAHADRLPAACVDPLALERILANLLYNAVKFSAAEGRVTIRSAAEEREVVIAVHDAGPGIPADVLPRLFERFHATPASQRAGGTGLGLFIVKTLTEANGGRVEASTSPDGGACFSLRLPAQAAGPRDGAVATTRA
jgi:signal transduction histidine kinase